MLLAFLSLSLCSFDSWFLEVPNGLPHMGETLWPDNSTCDIRQKGPSSIAKAALNYGKEREKRVLFQMSLLFYTLSSPPSLP